jgi:fluoroquinolone transport system permease protein
MKTLIKVAVNDFRLVFRDNSLKLFLALPLFNLLVIRYGLPYVAGVYEFVRDNIPIILMFATMQGSIAFGFIYSMVLVDEKDTNVAKVYGILPVSKFWFVVFRLIPPFFLATLATVLLFLFEPFYNLPVISNLVFSALAGLVAPLMILFVAILSKNKIEAMTWQKLLNIPLYLPITAFFVPATFAFVLAIFPTFWAYQGFDVLIGGGNFWLYMLIGFVHSILLLVWMVKKFTVSHFK